MSGEAPRGTAPVASRPGAPPRPGGVTATGADLPTTGRRRLSDRPGLSTRVPDDGRGRDADAPTEIPPRGWLDVARRVVTQLQADNIAILAAAVALYLFLALIPALVASLSLYGLVSTTDEVTRTIRDLTVGMPPAARDLVVTEATEIASREASGLSVGLLLSVAAALFSASKGTQALVKALNIAYNEWETRGFLRLRLLSVGLTVGIVVVVVAGVSAIVKVGNVAEGLPGGGPVVAALRWPVLGLLLVGVLSALYRVSPDRNDPKWRWTTPGAVLAAILVALASLGLSTYTSRFGDDGESSVLGAVAVLVLWLFVSAYIILLGAELDSELEHQTARDSTVGPEQPLGERGAVVADHVAG